MPDPQQADCDLCAKGTPETVFSSELLANMISIDYHASVPPLPLETSLRCIMFETMSPPSHLVSPLGGGGGQLKRLFLEGGAAHKKRQPSHKKAPQIHKENQEENGETPQETHSIATTNPASRKSTKKHNKKTPKHSKKIICSRW